MKRCAALAAVLSLSAGSLVAQQKPEMPKPGPEQQKLGAFVGNWTFEVRRSRVRWALAAK